MVKPSPVALVRLVGGNRRRYGGYIAHLGVLTFALGIAASSTFRTEREATLKQGRGDGRAGRSPSAWTRCCGREEPQRIGRWSPAVTHPEGRA